MAAKPFILFIGDSHTVGLGNFSDIPTLDFQRWTGQTWPSSDPKDISIPDVEVLTPQMPYGATSTAYSVGGAVSTGTNLTVATAIFVGDATDQNRWIYIAEGTGQGGLHRIVTFGSDTQVTLADSLAVTLDTTSKVEFWEDAHAYSTKTEDVENNQTTISKTTGGPAWVNTADSWLIFCSGTGITSVRRVVSAGTDTIIVTPQLGFTPTANACIRQLTGGGVNGSADLTSANCALKPMRFFFDTSKASYSDPYEYPNSYGFPVSSPGLHAVANDCNFIPEAMWGIRQKFAGKMYCINVGASGAATTPYYIKDAWTDQQYSWAGDLTHNDWQPDSTGGLYDIAQLQVIAANALLDAGDTMDIVGVVTTLGTNDSGNEERANAFGDAMKLLRKTLRDWIADNGYTQSSADRIPWMMMGVPSSSTYYQTVLNSMIELAQDDPFTDYQDVQSLTYRNDNTHLTAAGNIELGKLIASKWAALREAGTSATSPNDMRPTLSEIRTKVKRRFEGSTASNAASDIRVTMFINDSLREIYLDCGSNAWFLRIAETYTLSGVFPSAITLKRPVRDLMRIESTTNPGRALTWKGLRMTDNGKTEIVLHDSASGSYIVHYMTLPTDLDGDDDRPLLPSEYVEWVVMLTCKRLAESAGNASLGAYYNGEVQRLRKSFRRDCLRRDRMRQESMTGIQSFDSWRNGPSEDSIGWGIY